MAARSFVGVTCEVVVPGDWERRERDVLVVTEELVRGLYRLEDVRRRPQLLLIPRVKEVRASCSDCDVLVPKQLQVASFSDPPFDQQHPDSWPSVDLRHAITSGRIIP